MCDVFIKEFTTTISINNVPLVENCLLLVATVIEYWKPLIYANIFSS